MIRVDLSLSQGIAMPIARTRNSRLGAWVLAAAITWALLWVLIPTWSDVAPSGDNVEQLVWSQGLELGYHKHPPLPTWILIGAEQLFPPSLPLTYTLSILGMLIGAIFLWKLADELLGKAASLPAVLATGCIAFFSWRAHVFNHNTVLVPIVYASAWLFLRGVRTGESRYWVLLGVAATAGMLTKYQYALVLGAFAAIAIQLRLYREQKAIRGIALSAAVTAVLLLPHVWWLVTNDFPPFRYAGQMVLARLGWLDRLSVSGGFVLQQVRDAAVAIAMLVIAARLTRTNTATESADDARVWVMNLAFAPLAIMLILGLLAGVRLENHWGMMVLQFSALPILYALRGRKMTPLALPVLAMFFAVQAAEAAYDIRVELQGRGATLDGGKVTAFDARSLARAVEADWQQVTAEPLQYLVGSTTWAGFISLYSANHPQVLISGKPSASPWVSVDKLADCGAIYIDPVQPPPGATISRRGEWVTVDYSNVHRGEPMRVRWAIVAPTDQCRTRTDRTNGQGNLT